MRVTERDKRLLMWVGEQLLVNKLELDGLLALDHLRFGQQLGQTAPGRYTSRDLIQRWRRYDWIQTLYQSVRGVHLYLTHKGLKVCGLNFSSRKIQSINVNSLDHHDAVNRVRLYLESHFAETGGQCFWISERQLLREEQLRTATHRRKRRPDGVLLTYDEHQQVETAIEVERTIKQPKRLRRIMRDYAIGQTYDFTFFYYRDEKVKRALNRALQTIPQGFAGVNPSTQRIHLRPFPFNN